MTTKEKGKHTATPWLQHDTDKDLVCYMEKNDGNYIAILECKQWLNPKQREANAAFIVKAVNSHEELLGACKEVLKDLAFEQGNGPSPKTIQTIKEAIQNAETKQ